MPAQLKFLEANQLREMYVSIATPGHWPTRLCHPKDVTSYQPGTDHRRHPLVSRRVPFFLRNAASCSRQQFISKTHGTAEFTNLINNRPIYGEDRELSVVCQWHH